MIEEQMSKELLGIVRTAMAQAIVVIKGYGDKSDLSQAKKDLPLTLRVIESAISAYIPEKLVCKSQPEAPAPKDVTGYCKKIEDLIQERDAILAVNKRIVQERDEWEEAATMANERFKLAERKLAELEAKSPPVAAPKLTSYLECGDLADLKRLDEVFSDGEGWDLPKERMARLSELGVIRHNGGGCYSITSFGRFILGEEFSRLPLETINECNTRLSKEHSTKTSHGIKEGSAQ